MIVSDADFRAILGRFATGVTVVTTLAGQTPLGLTVNAFASISLDPPLVMVSIDRNSFLHSAIPQAGFFATTILAADQQDLSRRFAGQIGDRAHRFQGVKWRAGETGAPVLADALGWVECRVEAVYPAGDHSIILGRVVALGSVPGDPLLYYRGHYGEIDMPAGAPLRQVKP
ncbi:MAG TPA: flavin reductase family protein [Ktedonobacterales bacterium]